MKPILKIWKKTLPSTLKIVELDLDIDDVAQSLNKIVEWTPFIMYVPSSMYNNVVEHGIVNERVKVFSGKFNGSIFKPYEISAVSVETLNEWIMPLLPSSSTSTPTTVEYSETYTHYYKCCDVSEGPW
jgi:hypothetical protein